MAELILALDLPRGADALALLDKLPELRWVKVGSILLTREGPDLIRTLTARGLNIFLDLKWHDIPNTVAGAVTAARELGVSLATVHSLGGAAMLEAATVAAGPELGLIGVTVLTSNDAGTYGEAVGRSDVDVSQEVERLALMGARAGLRGFVCSPHEVSLLRRSLGPDPLIVVPGIRRQSDVLGDQVRVATAKDAVSRGATHLVVGRPVLQASDPALVLQEFMRESRCIVS
ncbi:MAG TPA: orotidine-5'-phosphate decarboxylase [Gemmatimonadales bacterium]|nr:orotidine-5'-phosphate decarboxylase [Gemmatimonadales bacterium]